MCVCACMCVCVCVCMCVHVCVCVCVCVCMCVCMCRLVLLRDPWGRALPQQPLQEWTNTEDGSILMGAGDFFKYVSLCQALYNDCWSKTYSLCLIVVGVSLTLMSVSIIPVGILPEYLAKYLFLPLSN